MSPRLKATGGPGIRSGMRFLLLAVAMATVGGPAEARATGYTPIQVKDGGTIAGTVKLSGKAPELQPVHRNGDRGICGEYGDDESLVLGPGNTVANAVVSLELERGKPLEPAKDASLDQKRCTYVPHVQALPLGTELALVNSDAVLHNVHSYLGDDTVFNAAEPLEGQKVKVALTKPGALQIRCDVHPWMGAWIHVEPTPYFAVTGKDGKFTLTDVPPGTYKLDVWHERLAPTSLMVKVRARGTSRLSVRLAAR